MNTQFFMQFAIQRITHGLAGFDLSPWELPEATLVLFVGPAGQQDTAIPIQDNGGSDMDQGARRWTGRSCKAGGGVSMATDSHIK
jgi:hypothetical protein